MNGCSKGMKCLFVAAGLIAGLAAPVRAQTVYVATNGSHDVGANFSYWAGAATNLNEAVALANALVLNVMVSNGTYALTNEILVTTNITVQSVNGPGETVLQRNPAYTNRILTVSNANALVMGFTITNGLLTATAPGMAVNLYAGVVSNCVVTRHSRDSNKGQGGIVNISGGRMTSCVISNNYCWYGLVPVSGSGILEDSVITACAVDDYGAVQVSGSAIMRRCRSYKNGGNRPEVAVSGSALVENCLIYSNSASGSNVGSAPGIVMTGGRVVNCTIANNKTTAAAAGVYRTSGVLTNCIVYGNGNGTPGQNYNGDITACAYSCAPELTNSAQWNTTLNPRFVNAAAADYRLETGSPCVDTGTNLVSVTSDIEGTTRPRAGDSRGILRHDMGAYEKDGAAGALAIGFSGTPLSGMNSITSVFTAAVSGTNTTITWWGWDFETDGTNDREGTDLAVVTNTFGPGRHTVSVRVTNSVGETAAATNVNYVLVTGTDIYVANNGGNVLPYSSWADAATNLNDAVDIALAGCTVHVSNGSYRVTKKMDLFTGITIKGEYGRNATTVWRDAAAGKFGLFDLRHANASVQGLTMTNGLASGVAGSALYMTLGTVSNCVITGCSKPSTDGGGGIVNISGGRMTGSVISNNVCWYGLVPISGSAILEDSEIVNNWADDYGLVQVSGSAVLRRCRVRGNSGNQPQVTASGAGVLENCLIYSNISVGGYQGLAAGVYLNNGGSVIHCTITGNYNNRYLGAGSGIYRYLSGTVTDCIIYGNGNGNPGDNYKDSGGSVAACWYSCSPDLTAGAQGNITDNPRFANAAQGDFHLRLGSPCLDTGTNLAGIATDLEGRSRPLASDSAGVLRHDMGAYEKDGTSGALEAGFRGSPLSGLNSITSTLSAVVAGSNTTITGWSWDYNGDGEYDEQGPALQSVEHIFDPGRYSVVLRVVNNGGEAAVVTNADYILVVGREIYVAPGKASRVPYASWDDAASNLNDAVDAALPGCTVRVTNGNYRITKKVDLFTGFTVASENGPDSTTVYRDTNVAVFGMFDLRHTNAALNGFTITNGGAAAASALNMTAGTVSNCVIRKCDTVYATGGMLALTGGKLTRCVVTNNNAFYVLASVYGTAVVEDSLIANNSCGQYGLIQLGGSAAIRRTRVERNTASYNTSGVQMSGGLLENCLIVTNRANAQDNAAGAGGVVMSGGTLVNCTVAGNVKNGGTSPSAGGVVLTGGALTNCIVYGNTGGQTNNYHGAVSAVRYSCAPELAEGQQGNLTGDPSFANLAGVDCRLKRGSPCINTGTNQDWMATATDLDGNPRIKQSRVDMGAYESLPALGTILELR